MNSQLIQDKNVCFVTPKNIAEWEKRNVRNAVCKDLPAEHDYNQRKYCVLHFPDDQKHNDTDFYEVLKKRLDNGDNDFWWAYFSDVPSSLDVRSFSDLPCFEDQEFNSEANFRNAIFVSSALFRNARFPSGADFSNAVFNGTANFSHATFGTDGNRDLYPYANFNEAVFNGKAVFENTVFHRIAFFNKAVFNETPNFASDFNSAALFDFSTFEKGILFYYKDFNPTIPSHKAKFLSNLLSRRPLLKATLHSKASLFPMKLVLNKRSLLKIRKPLFMGLYLMVPSPSVKQRSKATCHL